MFDDLERRYGGIDSDERQRQRKQRLVEAADDLLHRGARGGIAEDGEAQAPAGGFVFAGWNGDPAVEARVKEETKATIRCIPDPEFRSAEAPTRCAVTGEPAKHEVVWARAY